MSVISHSVCVATRDQRFIHFIASRQGEKPKNGDVSDAASAPRSLQYRERGGVNELTPVNYSACLVNISLGL